jgi:hypothetical protein
MIANQDSGGALKNDPRTKWRDLLWGTEWAELVSVHFFTQK